jgi:hypothetical protein
MSEKFKSFSERPRDPKRILWKSIAASIAMIGVANEVEAQSFQSVKGVVKYEESEKPKELTNTGTALIESLRESGNEAAVEAYEAGIRRLTEKAGESSEEDSAIFVVYKDGSFVWDDLDVISSNVVKTDESVSATYIFEDYTKYIKEAAEGRAQFIKIHTHPEHLELDHEDRAEHETSAPPSTIDINTAFAILEMVSTNNEAAFTSAHFQVVTDDSVWDYGVEDQMKYAGLKKLRDEAQEFGRSLNTPEDISALNNILMTIMKNSEKLDPETIELLVQHGSILAYDKNNFEFKDPHSITMFPVLVEMIYKQLNFPMHAYEKNLLAKFAEARKRIQAGYKEIDSNSDGLYVLPPLPGKHDAYIKRWGGIGFFMEEKPLTFNENTEKTE